jgi:hypothetical protein
MLKDKTVELNHQFPIFNPLNWLIGICDAAATSAKGIPKPPANAILNCSENCDRKTSRASQGLRRQFTFACFDFDSMYRRARRAKIEVVELLARAAEEMNKA